MLARIILIFTIILIHNLVFVAHSFAQSPQPSATPTFTPTPTPKPKPCNKKRINNIRTELINEIITRIKSKKEKFDKRIAFQISRYNRILVSDGILIPIISVPNGLIDQIDEKNSEYKAALRELISSVNGLTCANRLIQRPITEQNTGRVMSILKDYKDLKNQLKEEITDAVNKNSGGGNP